MRLLLAGIATLVACGSTPERARPPASAAAVDQMLGFAASDLRAARDVQPEAFRDVRLGHVTRAEGDRQHVLCGELRSTDTWIAFATIETDPYEQWLGGQAESLCERTTITWNDGDLSSALQRRFDSLR